MDLISKEKISLIEFCKFSNIFYPKISMEKNNRKKSMISLNFMIKALIGFENCSDECEFYLQFLNEYLKRKTKQDKQEFFKSGNIVQFWKV